MATLHGYLILPRRVVLDQARAHVEGTTKVPYFVVSTSYTTTGSSTYCPRRTSCFRVGDASTNGFVCESVIVWTVCIANCYCMCGFAYRASIQS